MTWTEFIRDRAFKAQGAKCDLSVTCGMTRIRIGRIMKKAFAMSVCLPVFWFVGFASRASAKPVEQMTQHKVKLESVDYLGKRAVKIIEDGQVADGEAYAIVKSNVFHNGTIELELAGSPAAGAM